MKRLLIFTILFPLLVLGVYVTTTGLLREGLPGGKLLAMLVGTTYFIGVIPAWVTAGVDSALSGKPLYLRLIATVFVAVAMAELFAIYMGQPSFEWQVMAAGAVPAAICSLLSIETNEKIDA
ncbi:hypothetical protein [Bradyrhizobium roseum]|uniref:hypothetical protein n=1 Tax=Bradyrhizobium roseum TaxID=3056648 RepID=UPI002616C1C8|nr:hypothetical protein [Bradyrhizobium roseus]WKA26376.1 hypothetical protein QUH67_22565 [Bradyrhizobium roseus]